MLGFWKPPRVDMINGRLGFGCDSTLVEYLITKFHFSFIKIYRISKSPGDTCSMENLTVTGISFIFSRYRNFLRYFIIFSVKDFLPQKALHLHLASLNFPQLEAIQSPALSSTPTKL